MADDEYGQGAFDEAGDNFSVISAVAGLSDEQRAAALAAIKQILTNPAAVPAAVAQPAQPSQEDTDRARAELHRELLVSRGRPDAQRLIKRRYAQLNPVLAAELGITIRAAKPGKNTGESQEALMQSFKAASAGLRGSAMRDLKQSYRERGLRGI